MRYIFFDTETTGKPKNYNAPVSDVENWPRLVQLGYIVFDENGNKKMELEFIIKPNGFVISEEVSKIHGITQEIAEKDGFHIQTVLDLFFEDISDNDKFVGHNVSFDLSVVGAEYYRIYGRDPFAGRESICTMKSSTSYCKLPGGYGGKYKWPKLSELYQTLFHEDMGAAHTALQDIQNTAKCYFELERLGVVG